MVRKLGSYMGLNFDELIYSKLTEDLGGHPLLIRQLCSMIHRKCSGDRPISVGKALYRTAKKEFYSFASEYFEMIVAVLERQYPDEYDMLALLANEDEEAFLELARGSPQLVKHLVGYGIIEGSLSGYVFNIEAVAEFLRNREKFQKLNLMQEDMLDEISVRRNALEKNLRKVMKQQIFAQHGKQKGMEVIQNSVWDNRRKKIQPLSFSELFDPASTTLFFTNLIQIIIKNWGLFKNILAMESKEAEFILNQINSQARPDAHAKKIDKDTFSEIRLYFSKIEKPLSEFI